MGVMDFLFEGKAPAAVTTYGQTVENMPKWFSDYQQGLIARANAIAAEPYQTYGGPRIAGFSPDQMASQQQVRNMQGSYQPFTNAAMGMTNSAAQVNPYSTASPYLSAGKGYTQQGAISDITGAAQPYVDAASARWTDPGVADSYMSPYVQNVIDQSTNAAMKNYNDKVLPGLEAQFVRNGTYGSSAALREANRAANTLTQDIQLNSKAALNDAYNTGANIFGSDMSRQGTIGQMMGNFQGQEAQNLLTAGSQMGQLGATAGDLQNANAQNQLAAGAQMGNLGQLLQTLGYRDASALETIGQQQQGLAQSNLDLAYQDFLNQKNYPRETVDWMSSVIRGLTPPKSTDTTTQTPGAAGMSPLQQLATLGSVMKGWNEVSSGG